MVKAAFILLLILFSVILGYGLASIRRLCVVKKELDKIELGDPDFGVKIAIVQEFNFLL